MGKKVVRACLNEIDDALFRAAMIAALISPHDTTQDEIDTGIISILCVLLQAAESLTLAMVELEPIQGGENGHK